MNPADDWAVRAHVTHAAPPYDDSRPPLLCDATLLGRNDWGNLGRQSALRYQPLVTGLCVADLGPVQWVGQDEDGIVIIAPTANWVTVGSPAHRAALAALDPPG